MSDAKEKQVFTETLKGLKTAKDRFGTPIVEGEIIAYATVQYRSPIMKVAKILEVKRKEGTTSVRQGNNWVSVPDQKVSLRVQGAQKYGATGDWQLQQKSSLKKIENVLVITDPPQEVVDLFEGTE